ncbi:YobI family P-loop NTPase [Phocaeicola coprophilus]|uniref:YobI family P-loop NTPase n=1 Tax=Phocaeicola coprophilus TaxID=387090 RepID=UPI0026DA9DF1|nr:hypothetical protein [Phocaeicola coprophilus]
MEEQVINKEMENNKGTEINISEETKDISQNVLLPKLLDKNDAAYKSVEELNKVITLAMKEKRVRNIALTGPYGSGKSSILQTFIRDYKKEKKESFWGRIIGKKKYKILNISLATLQSEDSNQHNLLSQNEIDNTTEYENIKDEFSKRIEYSILQQIIYKEKKQKIPNSRLSKIIYTPAYKLYLKSFALILLIIAVIIAFKPQFLKIESIYNALNFGKWNLLADGISISYIFVFLLFYLKKIISSCINLRPNKLNINGNSIELTPNTSIFNKHFDEILYFFQACPYNIVIIEDLDRFKNPDLFLKLREVNFLLNESNAIKQHIVFVYAVKDDIFNNEDRTKFFDYIIPIIPVINTSNSEEKLIELMKENGCDYEKEGITEDDLYDISLFIHDMRMLKNIVNEYKQYKSKIVTEHNRINNTKLLAMVVYKNYFPKNFTLLHKNDDCIYHCMQSRMDFIELASEEIDKKEEKLKEEIECYKNNKHLQENDLRYIFLQFLRKMYKKTMTDIYLNGRWYSLEEISQNKDLFLSVYNSSEIYCEYNEYSRTDVNIDCKVIDKSIDFTKRMQALDKADYFEEEKYKLRKERIDLEKLSISELLKKYDIGDKDKYKSLKLPPMVDVFIRQGLIDEDYNDYISFFYPYLLTESDRKLLISIKQDIKYDYGYPINKIENFVKRLKDHTFTYNAILNNDILDYIAKNKLYDKCFIIFMEKFEKENSPLDFLSQYYLHGKQQKIVFEHFIKWNRNDSWEMICKWKNEDERNNLIEAWIKYAGELDDAQKEWLSDKYNFIVERCNRIELKRCKEIVSQCCFKEINSYEKEILDSVIENNSYDINPINLMIILGHLKYPHITVDQIDLTKITDIGNEKLTSYIKDNITKAFGCFSKTSKEESPENMLYLLIEQSLTDEQKEDYLSVQMNMLNDDDLHQLGEFNNLAFKLKIVNPSWKNISDCLSKCQDWSIMFDYIKHFTELLSMDYVSSEQSYGKKLFDTVFASNDLDIDSYKTLCQCFKDEYFDGNNVISSLEPERLICLINNDKIPFTDGNISILKGTEVYSNYLIHNKADFLENISKVEINKPDVAKDILESDELSYSEKETVIKKIPESMMFCSPELSNSIINVILNTGLNMNEGTLKELIKTSTKEELRVRLANKMIKDLNYNEDEIIDILSLLGEQYESIYLSDDNVSLDNTKYNVELCATLKEKNIITLPKPSEDKKLRVRKK